MARKPSGFTLLEVMVAVAIVGIMATIGLGAIEKLRKSGDLASSLQTMMAHVAEARLQAMRRGYPVVMLFYVPTATEAASCPTSPMVGTSDARNCMRYYLLIDRGPSYIDITNATALAAYDPDGSSPASGNDERIERVAWSGAAIPGTRYGSGTITLPAPFDTLPLPTSGTCSFCSLTSTATSASGEAMGAVVFNPDGTVNMTGATSTGGTLVFSASSGAGGNRVFAVTRPLGLAHVF